ncbi:RraA family protein [Microbacterium sp. DT81.1]|uniref:RraA family protein n=1 Tax=Microbacterium sp. DT81.1 TaxID=3393413 RepID=UPI003CE84325
MDAMTQLSTAATANAMVRLGIPATTAPFGLRSLAPHFVAEGPAVPITHLGSVDVLLEAIGEAPVGSVLVIDNGGRRDESCVGDLLTLEAQRAGLAGIVIWGLHRDTTELLDIGLPVFSLGSHPRGPIRVPPGGPAMYAAVVDGIVVRPGDGVVADADGVVFVPRDSMEAVGQTARAIMATEKAQSEQMRGGVSLRDQIGFEDYLAERASNPTYSLRDHLKARGGAVET